MRARLGEADDYLSDHLTSRHWCEERVFKQAIAEELKHAHAKEEEEVSMAKVGEFKIVRMSYGDHNYPNPWDVWEQTERGIQTTIATCANKEAAERVRDALNRAAESDVPGMSKHELKAEFRKISQEHIDRRARRVIAEEFVAGRLSLPNKEVTIRQGRDVVGIRSVKGGDQALTITIE